MKFRVRYFWLLPVGLLVLFSCDLFNSKGESAVDPVPVNPAFTSWYERHNDRVSNVITGQKLILIGDSLTQFWEGTEAYEGLLARCGNKITNLGFGGDQTQNVIWRLENGEFPPGINPEYVSLLIGSNNRQSPNAIAQGIAAIIKIINRNAPAAKILLFSLLPRETGLNNENTRRNNEVNELIKHYHGQLNVQYVNIAPCYLNPEGSLKNELFTDTLHLTEGGYNIWKDKLEEMVIAG
ncbi:MAG: GDSL-type esterase/lipase family protein [Spirochaetales bacterium]|jgi:beta-glucosidase|nr:GDSL-type esterase/lipase family protein [Spirochaetales bacterium]